ncbi:MAG: alginate export family protein, partial [Acidobacteriota bacterium]
LKPRPWIEFNYATGDANAKDGIRGTFDQLYPTAHDKYGLADQVGWKNIKDLHMGVETKPRKNWTATLEYNDWYLADPHDALYNTSSTAIARSTTGTAGTHVGQELDLTATWIVFSALQTGAGIGHLFPGEFLRKTTPGYSYTYPYVMLTYRF